MLGDDKLPPVTQPYAVPASIMGTRGRSGVLSNSFSLPTIIAHRADFIRSGYNQWGSQTRQGVYFRARGESMTVAATSGRRTSYDASRHVANAAAKARAIVDKLLQQMKSYHTFKPVFVEKGVYTTPKVRKHFMGEEGLETLDTLLTASTSAAVRHGADEHFMATLARIPFLKGQLESSFFDNSVHTEDSADLPSQTFFSNIDDKHWTSFSLWLREHPNATAEEMRLEKRFWDMEEANRRRRSFVETRQHLQKELAGLIAVSADGRLSGQTMGGLREPAHSGPAADVATEQLNQRSQWEVFLAGEKAAKSRMTGLVLEIEPSVRPALATEIVSEYRKNTPLLKWMDCNWRHHTHRHENAALRIQCAYRCYRAKVVAAQQRYRREFAFLEGQREEENHKRAWKRAVRMMKNELITNTDETSRLLRALNFVYLKLFSRAKARRARKKAEKEQELEVIQYAAVSIQRVYRGFVGRELARGIRCPELLEQKRERRLQAAVICFQAVWRGKMTRAALRKQLTAVLVIQRLVRLSAARARRRHLRLVKRIEMEEATRRFAAKIVIRFLQKCVLRRKGDLKRHVFQVLTLQRVARGWVARVQLSEHQRRLRAVFFVQRHFRGRRGREVAAILRKERDNFYYSLRCADAVMIIENAWRRVVAGRKAKKGKGVFTERGRGGAAAASNFDTERASLLIGQCYRSMRQVRRARAERDGERRELLRREAVERIICFYRAFKYHKRLKMRNSSSN